MIKGKLKGVHHPLQEHRETKEVPMSSSTLKLLIPKLMKKGDSNDQLDIRRSHCWRDHFYNSTNDQAHAEWGKLLLRVCRRRLRPRQVRLYEITLRMGDVVI